MSQFVAFRSAKVRQTETLPKFDAGLIAPVREPCRILGWKFLQCEWLDPAKGLSVSEAVALTLGEEIQCACGLVRLFRSSTWAENSLLLVRIQTKYPMDSRPSLDRYDKADFRSESMGSRPRAAR